LWAALRFEFRWTFAALRAQLPTAVAAAPIQHFERTDPDRCAEAIDILGYISHQTKVFADPSHGRVVNSVSYLPCVGEEERRTRQQLFLDRNPSVAPIRLEQGEILAMSLGYHGVRTRISPMAIHGGEVSQLEHADDRAIRAWVDCGHLRPGTRQS
jgi:hypothetical protein